MSPRSCLQLELLAAHHDVRTAVGLAEGDGNFGHCGLTVSVEQFGSVNDDSAVLLLGSGQEARNVHEGYERDVEGVAETYEAGSLPGGVDVQNAGQVLGLVGHDTH